MCNKSGPTCKRKMLDCCFTCRNASFEIAAHPVLSYEVQLMQRLSHEYQNVSREIPSSVSISNFTVSLVTPL